MFSKIFVNGPNAHPFYTFLKSNSSLNKDGKSEEIPWNFAKFVLDRHGQVVDYFGPKVHPDEIRPLLEKLIAE